MPTYLYRCDNGHEVEIVHHMGETVSVPCSQCGCKLHRRYLAPMVKWSSFIEPSPAIKEHLRTVDAQRDAYLEHHHD